jgi:hypothetical protein|tara:strand:+ start:43 stop:330 length:288 start_codon:yes stop_codon:yes gene_type:complete
LAPLLGLSLNSTLLRLCGLMSGFCGAGFGSRLAGISFFAFTLGFQFGQSFGFDTSLAGAGFSGFPLGAVFGPSGISFELFSLRFGPSGSSGNIRR